MGFLSYTSYAQCNGFEPLCSKQYNEVAYLTTHNAYNNEEEGFDFPNQYNSITQQLEGGVRALMLDVYNEGGVPTVYHGISIFGNKPLTENLDAIKAFLDTHPNEIVTIIFECYVTADLIEADLTSTGLMPYLFEKGSDDWPTLQQMIDDETRLVIFTDCEDADVDQGWYHHTWTHAVETNFEYYDVSEFDCEFNRGDPSNDLFIINHFVTDESIGVGVESQAEIANENPFFIDRCDECELTTGKFPNFPTIDFYSIGDGLAVVNELNDLGDLGFQEAALRVNTWPNPTNDFLHISLSSSDPCSYQIYTMAGKEVKNGTLSEIATTLDLSDLSEGVYSLRLLTNSEETIIRKIILQ